MYIRPKVSNSQFTEAPRKYVTTNMKKEKLNETVYVETEERERERDCTAAEKEREAACGEIKDLPY